MQQIIQNIATQKGVIFTMEESSYFNGKMYLPVKTYKLEYPTMFGQLHLNGEYRRNTFQKPGLTKGIYDTDIYLWEITLKVNTKITKFKVEKNSWINTTFFHQDKLSVKCKDRMLKVALSELNILHELLVEEGPIISSAIRSDGKSIWTCFNTILDHEKLIKKVLTAFEEIEKVLKD